MASFLILYLHWIDKFYWNIIRLTNTLSLMRGLSREPEVLRDHNA